MKPVLRTARDVAVYAISDRAGNVTAALDGALTASNLSPADRGLARELALGTTRRRGTLEAVLRAFLSQPGRQLPGPTHEIMLVAAYQLLFLERVPNFAAVNEAVQQASELHHRRQSGLVNGVLRAISRSLSPIQTGEPPRHRQAIPISAKTYRRIDRPVFADTQADAQAYLAEAYSLPPVLAGRWLTRMGSLGDACRLAGSALVAPPLVLRVNRMKTDVAGALASLKADGAEAVAHVNGLSVVLASQQNFTALAAFRDGLLQPQDPTATAVSLAADPRPGQRVLDFCAAPGTKTTHLAELMDNSGEIVAVDVSDEKLQRIEQNIQRLGLTIVQTCLAEHVAERLSPGSFDTALVDAPCGNTGVLARRAESRWRFDEAKLATLAADQVRLVQMAAIFLKPGGKLVYSTCSIEPEEDQQVVADLLRRERGLVKLREELTLPGGADDPARWHDGGFVAVLRKNG